MAQKITYCLVSSYYDEDQHAFIDEWHKDTLYSLDNKADLKALALDALNLLVQPGVKVSLKTYVDRKGFSVTAKDLGFQ